MYILIISRGYPSEEYKINGIFEFDQAKALVQAGYKVIFASIDMRSFRRKRQWGLESFEKDGVQIESINIPCGRIPKYILNKVRIHSLKELYKRIESKFGKPDIIHAHFIDYGYIVANVFENYKIPLVLTEHFSGMNQNRIDPYLVKLGKYTYCRMDKVITVSQYLATNIKKNFGVHSIVIPNIVDTTSFKYRNTEKKDDLYYFVSTGSLLQNKRMDILIEAFYKTFKDNKSVMLYIYGAGPERKNLENMIHEYDVTEQIFLMGQVDRKNIADKMRESDCFVLASRLETFGVAYIEAMAMGLPVIATRCGGPEDFITEKNGVLIPIDDINALINAMKFMYENVDFYDKRNISDIAEGKFAPQSIANQIIKVYKSITNNFDKGNETQ